MNNYTFDVLDVFTFKDIIEAKQYINDLGYFGDSLELLQKSVNDNLLNKLASISFRELPYKNEYGYAYRYFLPLEKTIQINAKK